MNDFELLKQSISQRFPQALIEIEQPLRENGIWSLDIDLLGNRLTVEWSEATGFGISTTSNENFAEGPDEVAGSVELVQTRVEFLLANRERTSPPIGRLLSRLRERIGLTQGQLAIRLGVSQATISGIERRRDVQLSTLERVIKALGGSLEISGTFPDATYRIDGRIDDAVPEEYKLGPNYKANRPDISIRPRRGLSSTRPL